MRRDPRTARNQRDDIQVNWTVLIISSVGEEAAHREQVRDPLPDPTLVGCRQIFRVGGLPLAAAPSQRSRPEVIRVINAIRGD